MTKIVISSCILCLFWILYKWTQEVEDAKAYDDYSSPNPPLYVYYYTSGLRISLLFYFLLSSSIAILIGGLFNRLMDNLFAAIMLVAILIYASKQVVIIKSIRKSQRIDEDAPGFLITFGNVLNQLNNPLYALEYSLQYADKSYRSILRVLLTRLQNGQDPYLEVEKTKRFFRNRVLRNFLDDLEVELRRGNALSVTLERHIQRADDRKFFASERRIETYAGILVIYSGIIFEVLVGFLVYLYKPQWFSMYTTMPMGKMAIVIVIGVTGFMLIAAQRLILLSEG